MDSGSEHSEKIARPGHAVEKNDVDVAAQLMTGSDVSLDSEEALRLRYNSCFYFVNLKWTDMSMQEKNRLASYATYVP